MIIEQPPTRPEGPVSPMMSSSLWNRTSSPSWKVSMNLVMSLGGEANSIGVNRVSCSAMGVLDTHPGVVGTTTEPLGTTPGVLGIPLRVLGTPPGVLGIPPEVLGTAPEVLDSTAGVLGTPPGVLGTYSAASPPPWMTKCSATKVLVKPTASPCSHCSSPKLPSR